MVSLNFAKCTLFRTPIASSTVYGRGSICFLASAYFFPTFAMSVSLAPGPTAPRLYDLNSHAARRALHRLDGRIETCRIQIGHLEPGDIFNLPLRDRANLTLVRLA